MGPLQQLCRTVTPGEALTGAQGGSVEEQHIGLAQLGEFNQVGQPAGTRLFGFKGVPGVVFDQTQGAAVRG